MLCGTFRIGICSVIPFSCLYAFHSCTPFTFENARIVIYESQLQEKIQMKKQVCFIWETFTTN